jgi:hypothetical protein
MQKLLRNEGQLEGLRDKTQAIVDGYLLGKSSKSESLMSRAT